MSTRAIIAYRAGSTWRGVWNHWEGYPQVLGNALIQRIAVMDGDLNRFVAQFIDRCPEGWSNFTEGERSTEGGSWTGACEGSRVRYDKLADAHYLYLLDIPARKLEVYPITEGVAVPIAAVVFDEAGLATPPSFAPVPA